MTNQEKITKTCEDKLISLRLDNEKHRKRLKEELVEINAKNEAEYFLDIIAKNDKYDNENNLLTAYLLGICDDFDIEKPPKYEYGDYPDVD